MYTAENSNGKTGIAKKTIITTGQSSANLTEITSGLDALDIIVIEGINTLTDGTKLNF